MTSTTSTLSFDILGDDKKEKKNKGHGVGINIQNRKAKTVTVKGAPPDPPAVGSPLSQTGVMVPYMIGRQRIFKPNGIWYGNLELMWQLEKEVVSREVQEEDSINGSVIRTPVTTIQETETIAGYRLDVHLGLCLGPDVVLREIYIDNSKRWEGTASGARTVIGANQISDLGFWADFIFYDGRFNQNFSAGSEIVGITPPDYVGIAIVSISGANATDVFPQLSFEVERHPNPLGLDAEVNVNAAGDINPMTAAMDVITNKWGAAGLGTDKVDEVSFTAAATRLASEGIFLSIYNQEPTSGAETLEQIEDLCFCKFYLDPEDETIHVKLIRWDLYNFDTVPKITISNTSTIRDFAKSSWSSASSRSTAQFTNRSKNYEDDLLMALSPNVSGSSREEEISSFSYPLAMDANVASVALARDMVIFNQPAWSGEMQANRVASDFLPGDCFLLTWAEYNVTDLPCIVDYRRDIAGDVGVVVGFAELINPTGGVLYAIPEPSLFEPVDKSPQSPSDALVISAPYWVQVWAGYDDRIWNKRIQVCTPIYLVEAYNKTQSRFDVRMLNYPNYESVNVGDQPVINREVLYASTGQLVDAMTAIDGFSNGVVLSVEINGVTRPQYIKPTGAEGVREGSIWAFIDDEILAFEAADNLGGGVWDLKDVHRGLLDTVPAAHAAGAKVWIINGNWVDRIGMSFDIEPDYIPEFMFCSRTIDDRQTDDGLLYTEWTPDDRVNRPLRPMATIINGSRGTGTAVNIVRDTTIDVGWKTRSRNKIKKVAIFSDAAHPPEVANNGTWQTHKVWLTDSAATDHDLGETSSSPTDANELTVTVPALAATGAGFIWVQAQGAFGDAIQAERFPVNVT